MPVLKWDETGKRLFETGTDRGVLYVLEDDGTYGDGVAWNGLTAVRQSPDGAEPNDIFADNMKYLSLKSQENFKGTIEAYTYPSEFEACEGVLEVEPGLTIGQQTRHSFGMSYRTLIGNDTKGTDYGYKIHVIWGASVTPSERSYETINDTPNAITFSWDFDTIPQQIEGFKPSAKMTIDSTTLDAGKLAQIEAVLYGSAEESAKLPTPEELITLVKGA